MNKKVHPLSGVKQRSKQCVPGSPCEPSPSSSASVPLPCNIGYAIEPRNLLRGRS